MEAAGSLRRSSAPETDASIAREPEREGADRLRHKGLSFDDQMTGFPRRRHTLR